MGLPPDWYKDLQYRACRARSGRAEKSSTCGVEVACGIRGRRYGSAGAPPASWPEEMLAGIVWRDGLIGVARLWTVEK
jgi:nitrile hydratase